MKVIEESHLDHGLTQSQIDFVANLFRDRSEFFIETVELPEELGLVPCGLHGPTMGDPPVPEEEVSYVARGNRGGESRVCDRPTRLQNKVTVIAGPHGDEQCVLYTAFGGPQAPKEPYDAVGDEERAASEAFWAVHALSAEVS